MSTSFFVRRYFLVFAVAAIVIGAVQFLKGHPVNYAVQEALIWGAVSSLVYTTALAFKLRRLGVSPGETDRD